MNIAIIGGGSRCRILLELLEKYTFQELDPKVVAVADKRDYAAGFVKAREDGLYVTNDYNDFFEMDDIDHLLELTGKQEVYNDILAKKKKSVGVIDHQAAQLFWEILFVSSNQQETRVMLEKTKALYAGVINEMIQEEVMVIGLDYKVQDINSTMLKKYGLKKEEAVGRYCYEISHRQDVPCSGASHPCPLVETLKTQKRSRATHIHIDKDDNELYYSVYSYPLFGDGKVIGVIEMSRDITKDVNLQKLMMQQDKLASIGRLAAGVAHEINNPMTTILTSAYLAQEDMEPDDPNYEELQTIADETQRCSKIVKSLLEFARQTKPAKKLEDINNIVMESIVLTRKQAMFNDVTLEQNFSEDLPLILVDKDQIEQAMINLSQNAIEATDPGGKVTFSTRASAGDEAIEIEVSDTGKGIPEEDLDKIFEPFFTTKESGTGLGMSITHGLIEQHGGTIEVESKVGSGTTFTIRFPINTGNNNVN